MAAITRDEEMFAGDIQAAPRASFRSSFGRTVSRLLTPDWVIQYGEDKAEEIKRQQFYHS